jgi:uncharacterized protein (DUF433 family)
MTWHQHLETNPGTAGGRLVVKGTRLRVDFLLGLMGAGWTAEQVLESYPHLTREQLQAVFAYAADALRDETYLQPAA